MDIKSILERLMGVPERQWQQGAGDNDDDWKEEAQPRPTVKLPKIPKLWLFLVGAFFVFAIVLPGIARFLTDMYWFESQGFESVFWRRLTAKWELFFVALVPAFLIYWLNWKLALKNGMGYLSQAAGEKLDMPVSRWLLVGVAAFMAVINALGAMGMWGTFLKFLNPTAFGEADPLFGLDISFYVFTLPFVRFLQSWLQGVLFVALIGAFGAYFVTRSFVLAGTKVICTPKARIHLAVLGALILIVWGGGYWIDRYELLFSPTGVVFGAGYTDMNVMLPSMTILAAAAFVGALLLLMNVFKPMWKFSVIVVGVLLVLGWGARSFVPGIIQQYRVKPNEYEFEKKYINYHLDYTRKAFGLDKVRILPVTPEAEVTAAELKADQETVQNIRLWDYSPLLRTYKQLQAIRTYYNFEDVYIDRYPLNGFNRQVMLAVRELDLSRLQNPTWVNTHLEFTHGYGVVMNPVNEIADGGMPYFFMKDLPSHSNVDIPLTRPEIYFGNKADSYVLVNTEVKEFDYPMGASNARTTYSGDGGVLIGSFWRKLLFTLRFRDTEILFTGALKPESRVMFNRNVREALEDVAPFLIYDNDTYPVLLDGKIIWVQDAFTWSHRYPYSKPVSTEDKTLVHFNGVNYVRNSIKATVDAYNGKMTFYIVDDKDPLAATWNKIFPGLFRSGKEMSKELWSHMRYPEDFFEVQTDVYRTYHMSDTNTYYNREDVWEVTPVGRERRIQPNYVTMKLWGEKNPEFAIIVPYMPLGRDNLIGWMAGRCDPANYGELLVYQFPKQKLIYGPAQIEALIDQNPEISAQLSLWSQRGSDVIRGDLLVIPVGKSLLYVQPLYLKAENGELPELKRVVVSTGGRVAWDETFGGALENLMGQKVMNATGTKVSVSNKNAPAVQDALPVKDADGATAAELVKKAQSLYESSQNAQRQGNWAKYGTDIKKLGDVLTQLSLEKGIK